MTPISIDEVNRLSPADFMGRFGDVAEHSAWVAEAAGRRRPFADREAMIAAFAEAVAAAAEPAQRALLNAHPDLAGRAAIAPDSRREQAGAGLDRLSPDEFRRFSALNAGYRRRHGIPFILAVKGATKDVILAAFERRAGEAPEAEFREALGQVARIMRFRLEDRVEATG